MLNELKDTGKVILLILFLFNITIVLFVGWWWLFLSVPLSYIGFLPYEFGTNDIVRVYLSLALTISLAITIHPWLSLIILLELAYVYFWHDKKACKLLYITVWLFINIVIAFLGWSHLLWSIPVSFIFCFSTLFNSTWRHYILKDCYAYSAEEMANNADKYYNNKQEASFSKAKTVNMYDYMDLKPNNEDGQDEDDDTEEKEEIYEVHDEGESETVKPSGKSYSRTRRYQRQNSPNRSFSFVEYVKRPSHQKEDHLLKNIGRLLIPFELFDEIDKAYGFRNFTKRSNEIDKLNISESVKSVIKGKRGKLNYQGNLYYFEFLEAKPVKWRQKVRWSFTIHFRPEEVKNEWHNLVTAYTDLTVITENDFSFVTAYPLGHGLDEYYLVKLLSLFVQRRFDELRPYASEHLSDMLSTFLICNICSESGLFNDFLTTTTDRKGKEKLVVAANDSVLIFYAFDKQSANLLARDMDKKYENILVVYFVNLNFEEQIKNRDIKRDHTMTISIKEFMDAMGVTPQKKRKYELGISYLLHIKNGEDYSWIKKGTQIKEEIISSKGDYVYDISESLLEDALNILVENRPHDKLDVFHFLCASNLVNAYMTSYNKKFKYMHKSELDKYNERRMWSFKKHIFNTFEKWQKEGNDSVHFSFTFTEEDQMMLLANITIEGEYYQFRFRGMSRDFIIKMHEMGINDNGIAVKRKMQPIAPLLLEYSLCLRAKNV